MSFNERAASELLAACHRRCCICHRFCGVKIELDHIVPRESGGPDDIENAIPVCFECHAEIHLYNDKHPRGRKFRSEELRQHKEQWLSTCKHHPREIIEPTRPSDVGPLQALIDELDFNVAVSNVSNDNPPGCPFQVEQFKRAIGQGVISLLDDEVRNAIIDCYRGLMRTNERINRMMAMESIGEYREQYNQNQEIIRKTQGPIEVARQKLLDFLTSERSGPEENTE